MGIPSYGGHNRYSLHRSGELLKGSFVCDVILKYCVTCIIQSVQEKKQTVHTIRVFSKCFANGGTLLYM